MNLLTSSAGAWQARRVRPQALLATARRGFIMHEYQAAQLIHRYHIPIPLGTVAFTPQEAFVVGRKFGPDFNRQFVVKAQVHGVARSKGYFRENNFRSGIHTCNSIDEVREVADKMLGKHLVLPGMQANEGLYCNSVLVMEHLEIQKQYFLQLAYDAKEQAICVTYSDVGGLSGNKLRSLYPDRLHKIHLDYVDGINFVEMQEVALKLGLGDKAGTFTFLIKNLYECFIQRDCLSILINPLVFTPEKKFIAANTLIKLDPDAMYRQQELHTLEDLSQMSKNKRIAHVMDLRYEYLGGDIGIVSNSAGLSMASCDLITQHGGAPANFSDLGGAAIHESIGDLLDLLFGDPKVKVVFINCFGGLMSIEKLLVTLKLVLKKHKHRIKPIVLRAKGNKAQHVIEELQTWEEWRNIHLECDFDGACRLAVSLARLISQNEDRGKSGRAFEDTCSVPETGSPRLQH